MEHTDDKITAPGLRWRKRKGAKPVPVWVPDNEAHKAGYPTRYVNLSLYADNPEMLKTRCERLQGEMHLWRKVAHRRIPAFDGTFGSLINIYLMDPESSYAKLSDASRHPYDIYANRLIKHIGKRRIDQCDGRDVRKWFKVWAGDVADLRDPKAKIPAARAALNVVKASISFGVICRLPGCAAFSAILAELSFPANKRRTFAPTAAHIDAARKAAHAAGAPSRALAYALQYESTARQWDVTGQWVPLSDIRPSAILANGMKWIGPTWANIDEHNVLRITPTKTEGTTAAKIEIDLSVCPMVVEEMKAIAPEKRTGPLIVNERTGLPYRYDVFKDGWQADFRAAGLPKGMWNRDLRAGGQTEARRGGVSREDAAKVGGHSKEMNAKVYDRDTLEAHRRFAGARAVARKNEKGTP